MKINALGCCLLDFLYTDCSFESPEFTRLLSRSRGDGGLIIGGLVFSEALEEFAGVSYSHVLEEITSGRKPKAANLGGPAIVAAINIAQILGGAERAGNYSSHKDLPTSVPGPASEVSFYGITSTDSISAEAMKVLDRTPLKFIPIKQVDKRFPSTDVFSDATYHNGAGERTFVNTIGAAGELAADDLPSGFYQADIILAGGTGLVPVIHKELPKILAKAKEAGCITVVGTVFDFLNENLAPDKPWPLAEDYSKIDLLVMDEEESLKISGCTDIDSALDFFITRKTGACIITRGAKGALIWSGGKLFGKQEPIMMPICTAVDDELAAHPEKRGDTTGCGDNFLGGVTASLAMQIDSGKKPDLAEAVSWGAVSGGFACFCLGGTYVEQHPGEKREKLESLLTAYREQVSGS